ncbi:MAG: PHP domain-containing protein [Candidatus Zixiibacteriota bacterium]
MKIDFHLHTRASFDCESDPAAIAEWAVKKGLNGLVVTEHDTTSGYGDLKTEAGKCGLQVIPGMEYTVFRGTHYLIYLTPELPLPTDDLKMILEVHRRGGLVGLPHPYRSDTGLIYNQMELKLYDESEVTEILSQVDMIEVFNAKSSAQENSRAAILAQKLPHLSKIAGSDSHHPSTVGAAHTEIPGFRFSTMPEMRHQLKTLPARIITLPELNETNINKNLKSAAEGIRRLMVKIKPAIPKPIWNSGKSIYRNLTNRLAEKRAGKSTVK